jgi:rhamnose transport system permease protein
MKWHLDREWPALAALLVLYIFLAISAPGFYALDNLKDLALANISVLLVAAGMTLIIVIGQIDISVGSLFAVTSVACGVLVKMGLPIFVAPFAAILIGAALGSINGGLISFVRAPSIVVTLATMIVWRESLRWSTGGAWVEDLPANFQWFGLGQQAGQAAIVIVALVLFLLFWWASENLSAFRAIYATGSDSEAARLAGIPIKRVLFSVFVLMGAVAGVAAMLNAVRFSDVPANSGMNLELKAIAAVVVGGTPITGGRGSLLGTFIGVLLLGSIAPALTFLGVNPYWEKAIQGAIILATVLFDAIRTHREKRLALA